MKAKKCLCLSNSNLKKIQGVQKSQSRKLEAWNECPIKIFQSKLSLTRTFIFLLIFLFVAMTSHIISLVVSMVWRVVREEVGGERDQSNLTQYLSENLYTSVVHMSIKHLIFPQKCHRIRHPHKGNLPYEEFFLHLFSLFSRKQTVCFHEVPAWRDQNHALAFGVVQHRNLHQSKILVKHRHHSQKSPLAQQFNQKCVGQHFQRYPLQHNRLQRRRALNLQNHDPQSLWQERLNLLQLNTLLLHNVQQLVTHWSKWGKAQGKPRPQDIPKIKLSFQ